MLHCEPEQIQLRSATIVQLEDLVVWQGGSPLAPAQKVELVVSLHLKTQTGEVPV